MRKLITLLMMIVLSSSAMAKDGYQVKIKFSDAKDSLVYLCHYFGKASTVFKDDSTHISPKGEVVFKSNEPIVGGLYMILFADKSASIEFVLLNGDNFTFDLSKANVYKTAKFTGSQENNFFYDYQRFLSEYGAGYQKIEAELVTCKSKADTNKVYDKLRKKSDELGNYRENFIKANPNTFIAQLFRAIYEPEIPKELPTLPDGSKDSSYPRIVYKTHYWDKYDFTDDRLIFTPIYERKLDDYMTKLTIPTPDSVEAECDMLLKKSKGHPETFKYTLWYLTRWTETSKIMGLDEAFVYLVENYYMKGQATWIDSAQLAKYEDRARKIAPNMIGQPAMDMRMLDTNDQNIIPLSSVKADYTIVIFWSPTCGHCKTEMPKFDSLMKKELKKRNVKIYAVEAEDETEKWKEYIRTNKLGDGWIHVHDPKRTTNFRAFYDVYSTPTVYLLDDKKIIRGKRIDDKNILGLIDWLNKKKERESKEKKN